MAIPEILAMLAVAIPDASPWTWLRTLPGGSQSAHVVRDRAGTESVVKFHAGAPLSWFASKPEHIGALRAAGVPAPKTAVHATADGVLLLLELLPGVPDPTLTMPLIEHILALHQCQVGLAEGHSPTPWQGLMAQSLAGEVEGYCRHESLAAFSDDSRRILARIRRVGARSDFSAVPSDDLVHYDFHPNNILSTDGACVSGIVDWDAVLPGDHLLDLAMLTFTAMWRAEPLVLDRLWAAFLESGDALRRDVAMHHTVLRLVDWLIRFDTRASAERVIEAGFEAFARLDADTAAR